MKAQVSYSELRQWERSKPDYIRLYTKGEKLDGNFKMEIGKIFHESMEKPQFELRKVMQDAGYQKYIVPAEIARRKLMPIALPEKEKTIIGTLKDGSDALIILDGFAHNIDLPTGRKIHICLVDDYKTYIEEEGSWERWNNSIVQKHMQMAFYSLVLYQVYHCPTYVTIFAIDLTNGKVRQFNAVYGVKDRLRAEEWALKNINQIKAAGLWEKRLSSEDRKKLNNLSLL